MNRLGLVFAAALAACTCPPTTHVESAYAPPAMADSVQLCATEGACTVLCSRVFFLEPATIEHCRILELDGNGGAFVEVTWNEYVCQFDEWSTDDGDGDYGGDDGDYGDYDDYDDYDPCSDGSCDPTGGDDDPPPDDPPPDDPPPDDDPPMDEGI